MAYKFPPIDLLRKSDNPLRFSREEQIAMAEKIVTVMKMFDTHVHIIDIRVTPLSVRFKAVPEAIPIIKKIDKMKADLELHLGMDIEIFHAYDEKGAITIVGIPSDRPIITLRNLIDTDTFRNAESPLTVAVGFNCHGDIILADIEQIQHILIAGSTGSGKTVFLEDIIMSILYKASPEDVKLIIVDPKMVELGIYNEIPHLLIPVVTDPRKAAGSLQWAVNEMLRRYKMMSEASVRNLSTYNKEVGEDGKLPSIVIIIDDLADLMLVAAKEVKDSICRIAQMGRVVGMHLIIATQRPSANVITGLMKANIPSRIAFSVASAMESRIILDTMGAEKLVGKGDMLYAPIGEGKPLRVQGCFVTDAEVERVTRFVKQNSKATYNPKVQADVDRAAQNTGKSGKNQTFAADSDFEAADGECEHDEMLPEAVDVILSTGQASVSMLQQRLKLGYARASHIVDQMEELGLVGPFQGSKPRAILVTKEQWAAMRGGSSAAGKSAHIENM